MPPADGHPKCLCCLVEEAHEDSDCSVCLGFTPNTRARRHADVLFFTNLMNAGEDIRERDPPSKVKRKCKKSKGKATPSPIRTVTSMDISDGEERQPPAKQQANLPPPPPNPKHN